MNFEESIKPNKIKNYKNLKILRTFYLVIKILHIIKLLYTFLINSSKKNCLFTDNLYIYKTKYNLHSFQYLI